MQEDKDAYMTSNIDEATYFVCRGAKIREYIKSTSGNWVSFDLVGVKPEYRLGFGDVSDRSVGVAEFISRRNIIKANLTEVSNRPDKKRWPNQDSHS